MDYHLLAQGYQLLEPTITGGITSVDASNFADYLKSLYIAFFTATTALSVLVFTIGGLEYILSAIPGVKVNGKEKMTNALFGLGIALASYLILNTINPDLVSLKALTDIIK
jgi:hypothetical protein